MPSYDKAVADGDTDTGKVLTRLFVETGECYMTLLLGFDHDHSFVRGAAVALPSPLPAPPPVLTCLARPTCHHSRSLPAQPPPPRTHVALPTGRHRLVVPRAGPCAQIPVIQAIAASASHPDIEIAGLTFKFWGDVSQMIQCVPSGAVGRLAAAAAAPRSCCVRPGSRAAVPVVHPRAACQCVLCLHVCVRALRPRQLSKRPGAGCKGGGAAAGGGSACAGFGARAALPGGL